MNEVSAPYPDDTATTWRRRFGQVLRAVMAGIIATIALFAVIRTKDMPPAGPTCSWSDEPQSSAMGLGNEHTEWTPLPIRVCAGDNHRESSNDGLLWVVAGFAGVIGGAYGYDRLNTRGQRRAKQSSFSRIAEDSLIPWRGKSYNTLLALVDEPVHDIIHGPDGEALGIEVNAVIDGTATRNLRVIAAVDDGEWGVWIRPGCADFIMRPDGTFVGE